MTTQERILNRINNQEQMGMPLQAWHALDVLKKEAEQSVWFANLINDITCSNASPQMRTVALARLCSLFGVGSIVEGRLN